jgi:hypothetical protein
MRDPSHLNLAMSPDHSRVAEQHISPMQITCLIVGYAAIWALLGRYQGLTHDAQLYALQALATIQPQVFSSDLYLRFGSQGDFTIFSYLSGIVVRALGLETGAAALTFAALALLYIAVWQLARTLLNGRLAWLALGLLIVVPVWYGAGQVFQLSERFLTARVPAVALASLALAALIRGRYTASLILVAVAGLIHPLMVAPCVAVMAWVHLGRYGLRMAGWQAGAGLFIVTLIVTALASAPDFLMTGDWLEAVRGRSSHLFLDSWNTPDWQAAVLVAATAWWGRRILPVSTARSVVDASLVVALIGFGITAITTWLWPIRVAIQIQPWRWIWIVALLALILLVPTIGSLWKRGSASRVGATLLLTAWLLAHVPKPTPLVAAAGIALTVLAVVVPLAFESGRIQNPASLLHLSAIPLACATLWTSAIILEEASLNFGFGDEPYWVERLVGIAKVPLAGAAMVIGIWAAAALSPLDRGKILPSLVLGTGLLILGGAAPAAQESWSRQLVVSAADEHLRKWRSAMDEQAEVLWPEGLRWTWFVLGRKSYLHPSQLAGIVFSKELAAEANRRAAALAPVFPVGAWFTSTGIWPPPGPADAGDVQRLCRAPGLRYFISALHVDGAIDRAEWPSRGMYIYLYDCIAMRSGAGA